MQAKIIEILRKGGEYVSGEEISKDLKISRAAIWKNIEILRKKGYGIEAMPRVGYKITNFPDKLIPEEIQCGLKTKILGKKIYYYETLGSTMDVAFELGLQGAKDGTVVCSESQTNGKGRMGRSWCSPKQKGIYFSTILRPEIHPVDVAKITFLSSVAVCEAVKDICSVDAKIKWPNDILIDNKKVAGILIELNAEVDSVKFVVIGIGVNVNTNLKSLPEKATSLKSETGKSVFRVELTREILRSLEKWYLVWKKDGFAPIISRWKELSLTLGNMVRIKDSGYLVEGKAIDIDEHGGLIVCDSDGLTVKRMSGDVEHITAEKEYSC